MTIKKEILEILACPKCKGSLEYQEKEMQLNCCNCKVSYKIKDNIPIMLIEETESQ